MEPNDIERLVTYQIRAFQGLRVDYVKPHGALNNIAHENREVANAVARGIRAAGRDLVFVANCLSDMTAAAGRAGLHVMRKAYADRLYSPDGRLMPRSNASAVICEPATAVARVLTMLENGCLLKPTEGARPHRSIPCAFMPTSRRQPKSPPASVVPWNMAGIAIVSVMGMHDPAQAAQ